MTKLSIEHHAGEWSPVAGSLVIEEARTYVLKHASATEIWLSEQALCRTDDGWLLPIDSWAGAATLLVVAHNPGMQELASLLVATGDIDARERLGRGFPTAALATITFAAEAWSGVHANGGRLEHFVTPKSLAATTD